MPKKHGLKGTVISLIVVLVLIPLTIILIWNFGDRKYYLCSVIIILLSMIPFFAGFEKRKPHAREVVTIAVLCAIAVASRVAFIMLPAFKPIIGIVMIAGMAFGAGTGFLTGAISAFASNFIFGQGPWTPWQMFAYGMGGFLAGILYKKGIIGEDKRIKTAIIGALIIMVIVGPILDTCTLFTMMSMVDSSSAAAIYIAGVPFNAVHALAVMLTLLLLTKPMMEKLNRIKIKYGMMESDEAENDEVVWADEPKTSMIKGEYDEI